MQNKLNILVIGMGNHAQRIYIPTLLSLSEDSNVSFVGLDTASAKERIEKLMMQKKYSFARYYLADLGTPLSQDVKNELAKIVEKNKIGAVIISTPPDSHKAYASWALENQLHILMDKPISAQKNSGNDVRQASKLLSDFDELSDQYQKVSKKSDIIFMVNTQRRYEIGYEFVKKLIRDATVKFNIPVTSIQAMHSDGVWIFPEEIVSQRCHHYYDGYGKCSHSGFHLFDIVWQLYLSGQVPEKSASAAEVFSSFIEPTGILTQLNQQDYQAIFGSDYTNLQTMSDTELRTTFEGFGENDAFTIIRLLKENIAVCNISINLLHNSISDRSWIEPSSDLYKGNGRIKHQSYIINQGPFQSIHIHNYQSKSKQDTNTLDDYGVGGNNHFDIYVFRNPRMFGGNTKNFEKYSLKDLDTSSSFDDSRLYHETTKEMVVREFITAVRGEIKPSQIRSNILTYREPVQIMSAIYQSAARYKRGVNPLIRFELNEK